MAKLEEFFKDLKAVTPKLLALSMPRSISLVALNYVSNLNCEVSSK